MRGTTYTMSTASTEGPEAPPHKRLRGNESAVVEYHSEPQLQQQNHMRTSSLNAPTLQLTGHTGSVYALEYSPSGDALCSASFDKTCLLWSHVDYENYNVLAGHKNAVLDCKWCDEDTLVTASADKTLMLWDALTGNRLRKWQEHTAIINACDTVTINAVVSGSDDGSCLLWDRRQKSSVGQLQSACPVTAVAATESQVFTGGLDNLITCWDVKMQRKVYSMTGHKDTITCLAVHPESTHLLSNSMDHSLQSWDIRNFVVKGKNNRHVKTFVGHKHNAEKGLLKCQWSTDGKMVTAGSADKMVHIWDEFSTEELYLLPGHRGCVNTVAFHPVENIIASGASDKQIYVGELS
jgi:Prp8 binding protein